MRHRIGLPGAIWAQRQALRWIRPTLTLLFALGGMSCSYGLHPHMTLEGKPFSHEALTRIEAGTPEQDVLSAVGEPLETEAKAPNLTVWRYYERARTRGCKVEFLGFIPVDDSPIRTVEAFVFLRNGVVEQMQWSEKE